MKSNETIDVEFDSSTVLVMGLELQNKACYKLLFVNDSDWIHLKLDTPIVTQ